MHKKCGRKLGKTKPLLGIYGGTFDPIHIGHLRTAIEIYETLPFQQIRIIPCKVPPHRGGTFASAEQRWDMVAKAVNGLEGIHADPREMQREGISYTVDTLLGLQQDFPETHLCLIVGHDTFLGLPTWHRWQEILTIAHLIVVARPGEDQPSLDMATDIFFSSFQVQENPAQLTQRPSGSILFWKGTALAISSSQIRQRASRHLSLRYLVPDVVHDYINQKMLYGTHANRKAEI